MGFVGGGMGRRDATAPVERSGRGARSNAGGRFEKEKRESFDDGWSGHPPSNYSGAQSGAKPSGVGGAFEPSAAIDLAPATVVQDERARTIINYVASPFVNFDRSINMYRGCEHGCIYCFARPTHAYYGLSPGVDFETRLFAKPNAAAILDRELRAPGYRPATIAIGTNTDPYQPIERSRRLMRSVLEVLARYRHPVSILTKSSLIARDVDLIAALARDGAAKAMLSVTTLDPALARAMEPRASGPRKRLEAVRALADAGVPAGVMAAPMIPGLNDHELDAILAAAKDAGAAFVGYTVIRLPLEVAGLFREWLEDARPERAGRVMRAIREMNGGRDYDPQWSRARTPRSVMAKLIGRRFEAACSRLGLATDMPVLSCGAFRPPVEKGGQLSLFGES
ncbi:MAG: PA0069 family radical SAM protein [Alphaproteobacteria bacterium]|nr:PA0069 family radical SAM protein [Alphaproteobacteria bacterium]